jgi:hypothetical protein
MYLSNYMPIDQVVRSNSHISVTDVVRIITELRLARGNARGNGNKAKRRLARLEADFQAQEDTLRWYEDAQLTPEDIDQLHDEWDHKQSSRRVNFHD